MAVRAIQDSEGRGVKVSDGEIIAAIPKLARETGVFVEPAAAAAYAGFMNLCESSAVRSHERVVLILTGNGLKDVDAARQAVGEPMRVAPDIGISDLEVRIADARKREAC
jgi:threonine synthase